MSTIASFLPSYPLVDDQKEPFNETIFTKKEFYELKATAGCKTDTRVGLLNHQQIIQRFLSPHTLYDELLVYHTMGVGKTISALSVAESVLYAKDSTIKRVIILVKNQPLIETFINQLVYVYPGGHYLPDLDGIELIPMSERDTFKKRAINKLIRNKYFFSTHEKFYNENHLLSPDALRERYSNTVIIFDEVHNIIVSEHGQSEHGEQLRGSENKYNFYFNLFHITLNRKVLIMSGTPMRNDVSEFALVMNLILPLTLQLPTKKDFNDTFISGDGFIPSTTPVLVQAIQGRVTFLQQSKNTARKVFEGNRIHGLEHFNIVESGMESFQDDVYAQTFSNDSGWRIASEQASLFVFPNGRIGNDGLSDYVKFGGGIIKGRKNYSVTDAWRNLFAHMTQSQKLRALRSYSCKYARIIEEILSNPHEKCFIFTESITGGGAIILGECLKLFGFSQIFSGVDVKHGKRIPRFTILSTIVTESTDFKKIIDSFNSKENQSGQFIRIIIGGGQISEGFSFKDITQVHIATPHWNFLTLDQAIARAVRFKSHRNPNAVVRVYLHAAISRVTESVDVMVYKVAEHKDVLMRRLDRIIEKSCFDCALNYEQNRIIGVDGSRDCQYDACDYRCDGVEYPYTRDASHLDYTTYNLYYGTVGSALCNLKITKLFAIYFEMTISNLLSLLPDHDDALVFQVVTEMITLHQPIRNRYGIYNFLHSAGDRLYLSDQIFVNCDYTDVYYTRFPLTDASVNKNAFGNILKQVTEDRIISDIETICKMPTSNQLPYIRSLPKDIQEIYVELAITAAIEPKVGMKQNLILTILHDYAGYIHRIGSVVYSTLLLLDGRLRRWTLSDGWVDVPLTDEHKIIDKFVRNNPVGYYVRYIRDKGQINIVSLTGNLDKDYKQTGMNCVTNTVKGIDTIAEKTIGTKLSGTRESACGQLLDWFYRNQLVYLL